MKRVIAFLLCIIMLLALIACDTNKGENGTPTQNDRENSDNQGGVTDGGNSSAAVIQEGTYYKVEKVELTTVKYYIYDTNGNVVLSAETDRPIEISMLGEHVVDIKIGVGTGIASHKYYDAKNKGAFIRALGIIYPFPYFCYRLR